MSEMTWDYYDIQKSDIAQKDTIKKDELDDFASQLYRYAVKELKLTDKKLRTVLKILLQDVEINIGEGQMELDADRAHMRSMERGR